ncbi:hypothetical protein HYU50_00920 [Candidatus Woesearchaeota archaeon]|nr:hypothetical protein [Candidatus Woesearchaeota archaeon]
MLVDQETIKKIKSLGLNTYEVKIWTALLSRGVSTAGELSDIANVPRSRSYDVCLGKCQGADREKHRKAHITYLWLFF